MTGSPPADEAGRSRVLQTAQSFDNFRNYVGSEDKYDLIGAMQFNLLTALGLREHHRLLDIGCGSLRAGRLFIPYLMPGHYFGIDPNQWLIDDGIEHNLGRDIVRLKRPQFSNSDRFELSVFGQRFEFALAQSIFTHTSPAQNQACLAEVRRVLAPGGMFVVDYFEGPRSYAGDEWVYPGVVEFALADLQAWAAAEGLCFQPIRWLHPNGMRWALVFDARPPANLAFADTPHRVVGHLDGVAQVADHVWQVHGWAAHRDMPGQIGEIWLVTPDKRVLARARVELDRPDVAMALDDAAQQRAGWRTTVSTASLNPGIHVVQAYAQPVGSDQAYPMGHVTIDVAGSLAT